MTSPTFHVVPAAGVLIVAVGAVLPTVIVTESVSRRALRSVTLQRRGVAALRRVGVARLRSVGVVERAVAVEVPGVAQRVPGSGSLDPLPSKATVSGAAPVVGVACATAVGG